MSFGDEHREAVLRLDERARRVIAARVREPGGDFYFDLERWFNPKAARKKKETRDKPRQRGRR